MILQKLFKIFFLLSLFSCTSPDPRPYDWGDGEFNKKDWTPIELQDLKEFEAPNGKSNKKENIRQKHKRHKKIRDSKLAEKIDLLV